MSVALITGASGGIGGALARGLVSEYDVSEAWLVGRSEKKLSALKEELLRIKDGVSVRIITADLTKEEGIAAVKEAIISGGKRLKYLVNAAGFGKFGTFSEVSERDISDMIDLNSKATVLLTHAAIPYMERGGRIIQLGSGSCFTPLPAFNVYASSKIFVLHYTKALNHELKPYGIRATCFCPGWVETDFFDVAIEDGVTRPEIKKMKPMLDVEKVTRGCLRAVRRGKTLYTTNWYTKLQHLLFKIVPDPILTALWKGMLNKKM